MQVFRLPQAIQGLIFDIDRTLYTMEEYAVGQIDLLVHRLADHMGLPVEETQRKVDQWRQDHAAASGVRQSLGNTFLAFGISMQTSVKWREELIRPEDFLVADPRLRSALIELRQIWPLVAVTNNPRSIGERSLETLGVSDLFQDVVGLDTTFKSKPDPASFIHAAEVLGAAHDHLISIGDRQDVDIEPALSLGMGGILVDGVGDVYGIPGLLCPATRCEARHEP